jgi:hypothetical protein
LVRGRCRRFESREEATKQIAKWRSDATALAALVVCERENTEVTRKTAKGQIITETVQGSLERVPRIISTRKLDPTYILVNREFDPFHLTGYQNFTRAEAEQERAKRQSEADKLAALTEADIEEVAPTLAFNRLERIPRMLGGVNTDLSGAPSVQNQLNPRGANNADRLP